MEFCKSYTDKIFKKYDQNNNHVLDRGELKLWLKQELAHTPFKKAEVRENFLNLVANADTNGDGMIDRGEMYQYCLKVHVLAEWYYYFLLLFFFIPSFQYSLKLSLYFTGTVLFSSTFLWKN